MKNQKFQVLIGILLVPVLIAGIVSLGQRLGQNLKHEGMGESGEDFAPAQMKTMEEQGYVMYQALPERVRALVNSGLFDRTQEEEEAEKKTDILDRIGQEDFAKNIRLLLISNTYLASYSCKENFPFDEKSNSFVNTELIRQIESYGFTGFSEQLEKVARVVAMRTKEWGSGYYGEYGEAYRLTCQGTEFELYRMSDGSFDLEFDINFSASYVPEKYRELVEKVSAAGGYFLSASQVGGETEVLVFTKDNAVSDESPRRLDKEMSEVNNKKLILMFRNGSLSDYYVTVAGNDTLKLDDKDKEIIKICTTGSGKKFSDEYKRSENGGIYWIFQPE